MSTVRIQIDLAETRVRELEELMRVCDIATKKELFNNALTLLEWAVREVRKGNSIASVNEEEERYRHLEMPVLSNAAARSLVRASPVQAVAAAEDG